MDFVNCQNILSSQTARSTMKTRLLNWGTLFDKYENMRDESNSSGSSSDKDEVDISSELHTVSEKHSKVRKALCSEIGITEEDLEEFSKTMNQTSDKIAKKPKISKRDVSKGEKDHLVKPFDNAGVSDEDNFVLYLTEEDGILGKGSFTNDILKAHKSTKSPVQSSPSDDDIFETSNIREFTMSFPDKENKCASCPKSSKSQNKKMKTEELCLKDRTSHRTVSNYSEEDICEDEAKTQTSRHLPRRKVQNKRLDCSGGKQSNESIQRAASKCQEHKKNREPVQQTNPHKILVYDKNKSGALFKNASATYDSEISPQRSYEDMKVLVEQYELWKLYERRKSGQFGSLFIVSSLDEEPSEENRFKPDFPAEIEKPVLVNKRRFVLKKGDW